MSDDARHDELITSRDNRLVKRLRAVRDGRERGEIFVEGVRLCEEAVACRDLRITDALYAARTLDNPRSAELLARIRARGTRLAATTEEVFASVVGTKTDQGVVLLAARPQASRERFELFASIVPLLVVLHGVTNPANAGAILRAAEAAGASGAIATAGTCDLFSPKALRGAMGSSFRLPLWTNAGAPEVAAWCAMRGVTLFALDARGQRTHTEVDWTQPAAVVVGAEGSGFAAREMTGTLLRIPMKFPVESLNVAVALGIVLYEAARQRNFSF